MNMTEAGPVVQVLCLESEQVGAVGGIWYNRGMSYVFTLSYARRDLKKSTLTIRRRIYRELWTFRSLKPMFGA